MAKFEATNILEAATIGIQEKVWSQVSVRVWALDSLRSLETILTINWESKFQ